MVHGISQGGTLLVRGRSAAPGTIAIDVVDRPRNGKGHADSSGGVTTANSTGIGLTLVRALVGRELRGTLQMEPLPGGGTVATIEFPTDGHYRQGDDE
jgi:two-component sensor histidine kinase